MRLAASVVAVSLTIPLGLDWHMPVPEDNPVTREKVALGRRLFSDRILSSDRTLACATCHDPRRAFTDGRVVAIGIFERMGTRSAPSLVNRGYGVSHFWDGSARSLEQQALQPIANPKEMNLAIDEAVLRLAGAREYRDRFRAAFGRPVNAQDLARALASYVRTILSGNSPLDRYMNGDRNALSPQARQGFGVFRGKGNCIACHAGPNLTDEQFHNTGGAWKDGAIRDAGRFAVTGKESDRGAFKTPTLREIARSSPYMHDGTVSTLKEVVDFYDRGGNSNPFIDHELHPLYLTEDEKFALVAFLRSLNGHIQEGK